MKSLSLGRTHERIISWVGFMLNVILGSHRLHIGKKNEVPKKGSSVSGQSRRGNENCVEPRGFLFGTEGSSGPQGSETEGFIRVHWAT